MALPYHLQNRFYNLYVQRFGLITVLKMKAVQIDVAPLIKKRTTKEKKEE
ncbi:hypothetical protein BCL69_10436 [Nitrosomonas communis]|uniref:Uncharacterized protein n=1 Tax=Nitrosomonas communis TaxID=44574 RepID=A0A5D3Y9V9_9PROT|nr:hypothetical protein BCL69_10436 [Nitrosomonas communis]